MCLIKPTDMPTKCSVERLHAQNKPIGKRKDDPHWKKNQPYKIPNKFAGAEPHVDILWQLLRSDGSEQIQAVGYLTGRKRLQGIVQKGENRGGVAGCSNNVIAVEDLTV